jgi:hypothetical protein
MCVIWCPSASCTARRDLPLLRDHADLAALSCDWWDCVIDALGDNSPDVLCAGLAAVNRLFDTVTATGASGGAAAAAGRAALRLSSGVGPLLDTWRLLPAHAQVPHCTVLHCAPT